MKTYTENGFQYFYDRYIKLWTVYPVDGEGVRVEFDENNDHIPADHYHNKSELLEHVSKQHSHKQIEYNSEALDYIITIK